KRWLTTPLGDVTSVLSGNLFKIEMVKKNGEMTYKPHMLPAVTDPMRAGAERLKARVGRGDPPPTAGGAGARERPGKRGGSARGVCRVPADGPAQPDGVRGAGARLPDVPDRAHRPVPDRRADPAGVADGAVPPPGDPRHPAAGAVHPAVHHPGDHPVRVVRR